MENGFKKALLAAFVLVVMTSARDCYAQDPLPNWAVVPLMC